VPKRSDNVTPNITVHLTASAITPRRFAVVQLAQYLCITNNMAEELLRKGEIPFKWAGHHKVLRKRMRMLGLMLNRMAKINTGGEKKKSECQPEGRRTYRNS
jgi:hypothetical protein